jgi:hypothetical protein
MGHDMAVPGLELQWDGKWADEFEFVSLWQDDRLGWDMRIGRQGQICFINSSNSNAPTKVSSSFFL